MLAKFTAKIIVDILISSVASALTVAVCYFAEFPTPPLWMIFVFFLFDVVVGDILLTVADSYKTRR